MCHTYSRNLGLQLSARPRVIAHSYGYIVCPAPLQLHSSLAASMGRSTLDSSCDTHAEAPTTNPHTQTGSGDLLAVSPGQVQVESSQVVNSIQFNSSRYLLAVSPGVGCNLPLPLQVKSSRVESSRVESSQVESRVELLTWWDRLRAARSECVGQ